VRFTKMEGLGNDFIVLEGPDPTARDVERWCSRTTGIGADGVLAIDEQPSMRYWNADGSTAEMCGNGLRCVARRAVDRGWAEEGEWFSIGTPVGPRGARVEGAVVTVEIGRVVIGEQIELGGRSYRLASVGNPHAVTLVHDLDEVDIDTEGPSVETHELFPRATNVEFLSVAGEKSLRLRVWERGVGETLACGTGMVAAAAVAMGTEAGEIRVDVLGGSGRVYFEEGVGYLSGPATTVYEGTWLLT
jgi:diaminopimelate epimerase